MDILNSFINNLNNIKNKIDSIYDDAKHVNSSINTISQTVLGSLSRMNYTKKSNLNSSISTSINGVNYRNVDFMNDADADAPLRDRYFDTYDSKAIANISSDGIELNNLSDISAINHNDVNNSKCIIQNQTGNGLIKFSNNTIPDNCLDLNTKTFWYEEILSDAIIRNHHTSNGYYLSEGGAFAEIKIELESIRKINSITIKPMCKFPLYIRYIKYSHTDGIKETLYDIDIEDNLLVGNNGITIKTDSFVGKNIYIGINQVHYSYCDSEYKTINEDYTELKNNLTTGYLYSYGISYINLTYKNYSNISVYQTKDIVSASSINKMYIETVEGTTRLPEDNSVYTDTEYYITTSKYPGIADWISILPINVDTVECEKLFDLGGLCRFRFIAESVLSIKQNGMQLGTNEYALKSDYKGIYGVSIPNYNPNSTYTVSYTPIHESKYLVLNPSNKQVTNSETIKCNDNNVYTLATQPFNPVKNNIDVNVLDTIKNKIYKQIDGKVDNTTGTNSYIFNKNKFQYYIDKNKIFFNQNMDERYIVSIKYKVVDSRYKLKAILRRNTNKTMDLTQNIKNIKIYTENY